LVFFPPAVSQAKPGIPALETGITRGEEVCFFTHDVAKVLV